MEDISSLFNYRDPRSMMADRYAAQMQAPSGNLDQMTVQLGGNAGSLIGNALFGGRTSKMAEQAVLNEAIKESEVAADPDERLSLFAQALRKRGLEGYAQKVDMQAQERKKKLAETAKIDQATALEKQLRAELSALPANATAEQVEGVVLKYGDPDKILGVLQKRQDKELTLKAQEEAAKQRHLERLEIARMNNATRAEIAAMNQQYRQDMLDLRREMGQAKNNNKVLPASLQKSEDEDFAAIDTAQGVVEGIKPIIKSLEDGSLNLSGAGNLLFKAKAAIGSSDPEILQYQALERNLNRFVNESLRLNAGVQTDGDAQRAANEYQAAFSKNNTKAMAASLKELKTINERAIKNRQNQINRRRKNQGISTPANASDVLSEADAILGL